MIRAIQLMRVIQIFRVMRVIWVRRSEGCQEIKVIGVVREIRLFGRVVESAWEMVLPPRTGSMRKRTARCRMKPTRWLNHKRRKEQMSAESPSRERR